MLVYSEAHAKRIIQVNAKTTGYLSPPGISYVIHRLYRPSKIYWSGEDMYRDQLPDYKRIITESSRKRLQSILDTLMPTIRVTERSIHLEYTL